MTWSFVRNSLILSLLLFSSLLATQAVTAQGCGSHTGDLYDLPACAVLLGYPYGLADNAYLTSVTPQTIVALPGQNVSFAFSYQIWQSTSFSCGLSGCTLQLLFIASWTPWTQGPGAEYSSPTTWWTVYAGTAPKSAPGTTECAFLHLTVPIAPGT